jgi:hypothetical protein
MTSYNEPMGVPQGTIRAVITMVLIAALIVLIFLGKESSYIEVLASAAFGYYFGTRSKETNEVPRVEPEAPVSFSAEDESEVTIVSGKDLQE